MRVLSFLTTLGGFVLLSLSIPTAMQAIESTVHFEIQNEDDIRELESDGLISEETALVLLEMLENPLDLNRADVADLIAIPGILRNDALAILDLRQQKGGFVRWNDLRQIRSLSAAQRRTLRAFTEIRPRMDRIDGQLRIDTWETGEDGKPYRSRLRLRSDVENRLFLGVAVEHEDDAEYQWEDARLDLIAPGWRLEKLYLAWRPGGVWEQIIVGNFTAGFGSGLTFNDAHRFVPKGLYTDDTTSPYRQRGVGATWRMNRWRGSVFISDSDAPVTLPAATTGLSRQQQIGRVYDERLIGSEVGYLFEKNTQIGGVWYHGWIDKRIDTEFRNLPNRDRWSAIGLYARTEIGELDLRGEIARTLEAGWASYVEAGFRTRAISFLTSFRRYAADFDNPHSHGFADSDDTTAGNVDGDIDEVGVFLRIRYRPHQRLRLRAYYDQWKHLSSSQADNEAYAEAIFDLFDSVELGVSGKWNDDEISVEGDERRSGLLWFRFQPHPALYLTPVYRTSRRTSLSRVTSDDYIYLKIEWLLARDLEWEVRWKVNDTALIDGDTFPKEFYIQLQLWNWWGISGRARYTESRFGADSTAKVDPRRRIYVRSEYRW